MKMTFAFAHIVFALETVADAGQQRCKLKLEGVEVALAKAASDIPDPRLIVALHGEIVGSKQRHHTGTDLLVREIQPVGIELPVVSLDGEVTALI